MALSSVFSADHSHLIEVDLRTNKLEDVGIRLLCDGLRSEHCKLMRMSVDGNVISVKERRNLTSQKKELNSSGRWLAISM
ncbi:NACHT, LRR and PYD domains-containing protein 1-like [Erpetoichthys calabaricus]|uniref:NACHT, LRR and PYD domains-containing protein 1-like n=1 Tax=Erpetoichthys calabaricus TaxID=27687 RepID=UPI00109F1F41|nr:NACHT, LRR and PYD domains-containing protein 1-like [Erpetoichthys calabaricus]